MDLQGQTSGEGRERPPCHDPARIPGLPAPSCSSHLHDSSTVVSCEVLSAKRPQSCSCSASLNMCSFRRWSLEIILVSKMGNFWTLTPLISSVASRSLLRRSCGGG